MCSTVYLLCVFFCFFACFDGSVVSVVLCVGKMKPVFCGNFEYDAREGDLERLFRRYGKVDRVDMKAGKLLSCLFLLSYLLLTNHYKSDEQAKLDSIVHKLESVSISGVPFSPSFPKRPVLCSCIPLKTYAHLSFTHHDTRTGADGMKFKSETYQSRFRG